MLKNFINRLIRRNHYWRELSFDELSELYTSMMFRSLAMSLVGIFIPIYLYQLDYAIWQIFFFYASAFSVMALAAYPAARLVAKAGPKHTILASYVAQVITMLMLVSLDELRWPLVAVAVGLGLSNCLYFIAFHIDFSKIKHRDHGGKELGWMISMEKVGVVLGPLVGGLVAFWFGPQYIFGVAILLLFIGIFPLFLTREPIAPNQHLDFRGLNVKDIKRDLVSFFFFGLENGIHQLIWPFFIGVYIFTSNPYIQLGSIISLAVFISILTARAIGKTIDDKKGRTLLRYGVLLNSILHLFRPFANGFPFALGVNIANEVINPAYRMPYMKGLYDAADDLPGRRIVYVTAMEAMSYLARILIFTFGGLAAFFTAESKHVFTAIFIVGALASLGILTERFKALDTRK